MENTAKTVVHDGDLRLDAYRFQRYTQPFPLHFHPDYILGLVERGSRRLTCKGRELLLHPGDLLLLNPGDSHACVQTDGGALDYRSLALPIETMLELAQEITGVKQLPVFSASVVQNEELAGRFRTLHGMILDGAAPLAKDEALYLLAAGLLEAYGQAVPQPIPEYREEVERVCAYIRLHLSERIRLDQLCRRAGLSGSTLLRAFTRARSVTPYRYLESARIAEAKRLLEQGVPPVEAALRTGFSDQSHFTNTFTRFIGLSPGAYRDVFTGRTGGPHGPCE